MTGLYQRPGGLGAGKAGQRGIPEQLEELRVEAGHVDRGEVVHAEVDGRADQEIFLGNNLGIVIEKYVYQWKVGLILVLLVISLIALESAEYLTDIIRNI